MQATKLLYQLSTFGEGSETFHQYCDLQCPLLVVVQTENSIFGYVLPIKLVKEEKYENCDQCWIFSIRNVYNHPPVKIPVKPERKFMAFQQSKKSPCLGNILANKQDLYIK